MPFGSTAPAQPRHEREAGREGKEGWGSSPMAVVPRSMSKAVLSPTSAFEPGQSAAGWKAVLLFDVVVVVLVDVVRR
jgi:glutaminase